MGGKSSHLVWNECGSLYDNAFIPAKFYNRFISLFNQSYFIFCIAMVAMPFSVSRAPHPPSRAGVSLTAPVLVPVCQGSPLCHLSQDFPAVFPSKIEMTQCCGQVLHAVVSHASSKMMILSHCCGAELFLTGPENSSCPEEPH